MSTSARASGSTAARVEAGPTAGARKVGLAAAASLLAWDEELCRRLASGGRFVIRYDHRDQGRSTSYPPGQPGYGLADLATDALGLLDALGVARAHLVGRSLGGAIARLQYLRFGLAFILAFVGMKLLLGGIVEIPTWLSLVVILGAVAISAAVSLLMIPAPAPAQKLEKA